MVIDRFNLEIVYAAIFLIGMFGAICLGRWSVKKLLIFVCLVAVLLVSAKAARALFYQASQTQAVRSV